MGATAILVDLVFDDAECNEIDDHNDEGDDEGNSRDKRCKECTTHTGTESEEEGDEGESAGDWVKDHDARQCLGCIDRGGIVFYAINALHDNRRVIADVLLYAVVLVARGWGHIKDAVAKGTKSDGGVANIAFVGEGDLQESDIIHDRRRDGSYEEQDSGSEEEEGTDMMKDAGFGHFVRFSWDFSWDFSCGCDLVGERERRPREVRTLRAI